MRRGFKAEAEEYAKEFRHELGIEEHMPLCPWKLAEHLCIPIMTLSAFGNMLPEEVLHLKNKGQDAFSAVTVLSGRKRLVIHNDFHHPKRQSNNIAHELAHGILCHPASPILNGTASSRKYDKEIEDEANWLGATLLVPKEATWFIVSNRMSITEASDLYNVSHELLNWRIRMTGANVRYARKSRKTA